MNKTVKRSVGLYNNLPNEEYHEQDGFFSSSVLKTALENPVEFRRVYVEGHPKKSLGSESALTLGNYMHTWLLEPEKFDSECAVYPAKRRGGKNWEFFKDNNKGKYIITQAEAEVAESMKTSFDSTDVQLDEGLVKAPLLFSGGTAEQSLFLNLSFPLDKRNSEILKSETHTLPVKVRADYILQRGDHFILRDLKTTSKCPNDVRTARKICYEYFYFLSAALYLDAFSQHFNIHGEFAFVFSSKMDYATNYYKASEKSLAYGRGQYVEALNNILNWRLTNSYPKGLVREI